MSARARRGHSNSGFTLLEVLIAMVVITFGLLGVAALQVESLRSSRTAMLRTKAVILASDMASRIRSNRGAALSGNYVVDTTGAGLNNNCSDDLQGGPTVSCTPQQLAAHDIWMWKRALAAVSTGLPGPGTASVSSDGGLPATLTVTLFWSESGTDYRYDLAVQP